MTHILLTVDGTAVMDGDLGAWSNEPPAITDLKLKAGTEPWAIPTPQAIATAAITATDTTIAVQTRTDGWAMDVNSRKP